MKMVYDTPEMEVVRFVAEDIICTSGADTNYPTSDDIDDIYPDDYTEPTDGTDPTEGTQSGGLTDGGAGGDVGSGDSDKWGNLFPGLSNP